MDIIEGVRNLIRTYKTRNPFEIINGMNVILIMRPLYGVRGFYQHFQRNNIIYIDDQLSDKEKDFVCAHELGHMILHKKSNYIFMDTRTRLNTNRYENEANLFAAELLISDEIILENHNCTISQLSRILGYDKALIELRLNSYQNI